MESDLVTEVQQLLSAIDEFSALPEEDQNIQRQEFTVRIRANAQEVYEKILLLPKEEERNVLFDEIINRFKDAKIVATTIKALAEIFR